MDIVRWMGQSWGDRLMRSLDGRAAVFRTPRGEVQLAMEGSGPPVLVVHGGPGGFDQGLAWGRHLRDGGCEVLAVSRPGYLRTPLESGRSLQDQADLYAAALDILGIERVAILGFSSGAASGVHFAARHPGRTTALFLDAAILLPFDPPMGAFRRATLEFSPLVWLSYQMAARLPRMMTRLGVAGVSSGLSKEQRDAAASWIASSDLRLRSFQEQFMSIAPQKGRELGWENDQANEANLPPLPFADVTAPTLIAHGANDAIVPVEHATNAANKVVDAELVLVEEGHHLLSLSHSYEAVAQRQLELVHSL